MDKLTPQQRSYTMSRIRGSGTALEKKVFKEIRRRGIRFTQNYGRVPGKPDIALPRRKKAVLIHSDFWHGWQYPRWKHVLPSMFWKNKIEKNRQRDRYVLGVLRRRGWSVLVVWEHSLGKDWEESLNRIEEFLWQDIDL